MSRDLANGNARRKRDLDGIKSKEPVFFKLSAFGQNLHLNVTINDELFSPNFEIEIRGNGTSEFHYEIDHCHYIGQVVPTGGTGNKVAISNCDGLVSITVQTRCFVPQAISFHFKGVVIDKVCLRGRFNFFQIGRNGRMSCVIAVENTIANN